MQQNPTTPEQPATKRKDRMTAALLAFILGSFGVHQFYLGNTGSGIARILITMTLIGWIVAETFGVIESITYITKTDEEFQQIYVDGNKSWF